MKHTINEEQNNLINSLDDLKNQLHTYFGEDSSGKDNLNDSKNRFVGLKNLSVEKDTLR